MIDRKNMRLQNSGLESGIVRVRQVMPMSRRHFLGVAAAAAGVGLTAGYSTRQALAATEIRYMGWQGYDDAANIGGFLDKNDMVMQATYMESAEQWQAAIQGGGRGNLDLGTPVSFHIPHAARQGWLEPLDMSKIPNMERVYPEFRNVEDLNPGGVAYAVPFTWGSLPLMYNADVIKEPPDSWWELFNPKYKGKVTVVEDSTGVFMTFAMMATGTKTPWNITREMWQETVDLMIKFKKEQALTITPGYGDLASLLGSGEVVIAQGWEPVSMWTGEDSPNIKWVYPKEGFVNFIDTYVIFRDAPNIELDHKILNHVMSAEAQAANAEINATAVANMDALPLLKEHTKSLYPYDDIGGFFAKAGGHTRMFPLEEGERGEFLTYDQILDGWEEFLKS
jgi:spermidine/putrescine-binding protein